MNIAVIGGGWAGLAATVELAAAGARPVLFEAGRRLGGRARTVDIDGRSLDNGQHILLGAYRETLALMRRVEADPDRLLRRRPLRVEDNSGFSLALPRLPAPFNLAWGLLTARGVGLREKLHTARWMQGLKTAGFHVPRDTNVAAWLDAAGQTGALRRHLWEPLCLAALNTRPERASARIFANVLRDSLGGPRRSDTDLLLPRVALGRLLPDPARIWLEARGVDLRTVTRVRHVAGHAGGVTVDGEPFDGAILAVAPQHAAKLLSCPPLIRDFEPIATIYLQHDQGVRLAFPLQALCGGYGQWAADRGDGLIACIQSGHGDWEQLDDAALARGLGAELGLPPATWSRVIREQRATFSCAPGLARPPMETAHHRLWLAGDYTWADYPGTLEGAVRSGLRAARACLATGS